MTHIYKGRGHGSVGAGGVCALHAEGPTSNAVHFQYKVLEQQVMWKTLEFVTTGQGWPWIRLYLRQLHNVDFSAIKKRIEELLSQKEKGGGQRVEGGSVSEIKLLLEVSEKSSAGLWIESVNSNVLVQALCSQPWTRISYGSFRNKDLVSTRYLLLFDVQCWQQHCVFPPISEVYGKLCYLFRSRTMMVSIHEFHSVLQ